MQDGQLHLLNSAFSFVFVLLDLGMSGFDKQKKPHALGCGAEGTISSGFILSDGIFSSRPADTDNEPISLGGHQLISPWGNGGTKVSQLMMSPPPTGS